MSTQNQDAYDALVQDISSNTELSEQDKNTMLQNVLNLRNQKLNIMITGGTGVGKSSTINALFDANIAKVGTSTDPETMDIKSYTLKNLILWDSPGLGDGKEADARHSTAIIKKLKERDSNGNALIDLVLVILDSSTRDYGTAFSLINDIIIPNLGDDKQERILVAINQCDVAMKGKHWNYEENKPDATLEKFLDEKVDSVKKRIKDSTNVSIEPIYYSAGYKETEDEKQNPYNLSKLLYLIIQHTPKEKRAIYLNTASNVKENWISSDNKKDYVKESKKSILESTVEYAKKGASVGATIGSIFGAKGSAFGAAIGGALGGAFGFVKSWFD